MVHTLRSCVTTPGTIRISIAAPALGIPTGLMSGPGAPMERMGAKARTQTLGTGSEPEERNFKHVQKAGGFYPPGTGRRACDHRRAHGNGRSGNARHI